MLMKEGKTIFFGNTTDVLPHFEKHGFKCPENFNPADFLLDTLFEKPTQELLSYAPKLESASPFDAPPQEQRKKVSNPFFHQTWVLFQRNMLFSVRHPSNLVNLVGVSIFLTLFIGWFYINTSEGSIQDRLSFGYILAVTAWGVILPSIEQSDFFLKKKRVYFFLFFWFHNPFFSIKKKTSL